MHWSRRQKFALTPEGARAEERYCACVSASHTQSGRPAFDAALAAWAEPLQVNADDGPYLSELKTGFLSLSRLVEAFEGCARSQDEVKEALGRLSAAGLVTVRE